MTRHPPFDSTKADLAVPMAAAGTVAALLFLMSLSALVASPARWLDGLLSFVPGWLAVCTALGAAGGGALLAPQFGLPGPRGAVRTAAAYCAAVFAGGLIGGTLAFPLLGTLFGPAMGAMPFVLAFERPPFTLFLPLSHAAIASAMHLAGRCRRRLLAISAPPPIRPLAVWLSATAIYAASMLLWEVSRWQ